MTSIRGIAITIKIFVAFSLDSGFTQGPQYLANLQERNAHSRNFYQLNVLSLLKVQLPRVYSRFSASVPNKKASFFYWNCVTVSGTGINIIPHTKNKSMNL